MEKIKSSLTNMVLVLVAVALITGGLLAVVNHVTAGPIAMQADRTLANGIRAVMGTRKVKVIANDTVKQLVDEKEVVSVVHKVAGGGAAVESSTMGFGGDMKVLVGFSADGKILGYTILASSETPGLGAKADKWFQKDGKGSIIGKNPGTAALTVSKDGGDVDAITASTITSRAFLKAVGVAHEAMRKAAGK
ncbi:RnfABCDGE type electron transport complex subunit G [Prevotella sp. kh1p2]|uniref:RnfABCDGE type electron transport complex subunit G n=1 Tax=Prevotella sp. kh1p2 TaxID=1761883 RepID=UPI0008C28B07|nr:RnfABCDGE type electron transport complex subunit G [Prevotella sp. kh1p2]SET06656.1 electron transport complex protein RnfG [Prevotella sp. kh1p2]SNU10885.1 electron transport complex protein RnfG [Prevotellaceae bacterium KH2P17]